MRKILVWLPMLLLIALTSYCKSGEPVVIEVISNKSAVGEALQSAKTVLMGSKFIAANGVQESSFTATRTTGAKADYYVADVSAAKENGKVKLTISFVKVGTGLLSLKKVAAEIKQKLEDQ